MEQDDKKGTPKAAPDLEEAAENVKGSVKEKIDHAKDYLGERYQAVSDKVKDRYDSAASAAREKASEVRSRVDQVEMDDVVDQMRDYVRSNPGKALLISIGVGFVIGLVMRGTDDEDED